LVRLDARTGWVAMEVVALLVRGPCDGLSDLGSGFLKSCEPMIASISSVQMRDDDLPVQVVRYGFCQVFGVCVPYLAGRGARWLAMRMSRDGWFLCMVGKRFGFVQSSRIVARSSPCPVIARKRN
jgi:hypothetical protein